MRNKVSIIGAGMTGSTSAHWRGPVMATTCMSMPPEIPADSQVRCVVRIACCGFATASTVHCPMKVTGSLSLCP